MSNRTADSSMNALQKYGSLRTTIIVAPVVIALAAAFAGLLAYSGYGRGSGVTEPAPQLTTAPPNGP
jgi:flagellar basal body-associated protein FliL